MTALVWKHGTTAAIARDAIRTELAKLGHASNVTWKDYEFTSSLGWGTILSTSGSVNADEIILDKCSGALGGIVLAKSREFFERVSPGGEQA